MYVSKATLDSYTSLLGAYSNTVFLLIALIIVLIVVIAVLVINRIKLNNTIKDLQKELKASGIKHENKIGF
ncbi:hypothetical protein [Pectinatus frisingensis]|uniref:hypothetical protein n=1 Tax=Pectinatus frisingensis TaxID=865 RepID=UPI0018C49D7C|nr:hypothetical protein [Pectinatus frisingensis]